MKVNIGIYNRISGRRITVTRNVKLKKFRKLMTRQGWAGSVRPLPLSWIKGDFRAHSFFGVEPCLIDPSKWGAYSSGANYE